MAQLRACHQIQYGGNGGLHLIDDIPVSIRYNPIPCRRPNTNVQICRRSVLIVQPSDVSVIHDASAEQELPFTAKLHASHRLSAQWFSLGIGFRNGRRILFSRIRAVELLSVSEFHRPVRIHGKAGLFPLDSPGIDRISVFLLRNKNRLMIHKAFPGGDYEISHGKDQEHNRHENQDSLLIPPQIFESFHPCTPSAESSYPSSFPILSYEKRFFLTGS